MTYRAILFDLDGTLLDSVPIILDAASRVFADMALPYDEAVVRRSIGIPLRVQALHWAGSRADEFRERYREVYRDLQEKRARLFPGTSEMLADLKSHGRLTGVVTSKVTWATQRALDQTGISEFFDTVITADDVVHHKPRPDPILKGMESLGVGPRDTLYVGDSMFDIQAARAASVDVVAVTWGAMGRDDLLTHCPDDVFDSWPQFTQWLCGR